MADGRTITASTGFPEFDQVLGGLYWGDNVVWEAEQEDVLAPFYRVIAAGADEYDEAAYVTLAHEPDAVRDAYPMLEVIDAREGTDLAEPRPLLEAIRERCLGPSAISSSSTPSRRSAPHGVPSWRSGSLREAARCCSVSARSRTGRSPPPGTRQLSAARSTGSPSACSSSARSGYGSRRPRAARPEWQEACFVTGSRTACRCLPQLPLRPVLVQRSAPSGCSAGSARASRAACGCLGKRDLAGRTGTARALAPDAPRSERPAQHHDRRASPRGGGARVSPRPAGRSAS